ncbi:response regulator [Bdellovibrio bacteriovorus]|uniref:response regulator n=2 Tax=Bdellovibrio TaxID=958 RepID=UPI0035A6836C
MSHEIRTPMNAILGFADLLANEKMTEEQKEYLARIQDNGTQLLRIIDDILDLSKFEAGKVPIEKALFSYSDLLDEVVSSLSLLAQKKGMLIQVDYQSEIPELVCSDPVRVRQILVNLLSNAIKFSEKGPIRIRVSSEHLEDKNKIQTEVEDLGIGISEEGQKKLFQAFGQADTSIVRKFGGTGLGLALSRHISRAMGGDLVLLHSQEGKGSTFLFTLLSDDEEHLKGVLRQTKEEEKASQQRTVTLQDFQGKTRRILLAEDTPDNQLLIRRYLKSDTFKIDSANDGYEALDKALHEDFDVILMDVQMPGMDGLEATKQLRAQGYQKPIIALTAHALPEEIEKSIEAGCNAHLTKPVSRSELLRAIDDVLK